MISVLIPTRHRVLWLVRVLDSLDATVVNKGGVEVVIYVDDDDALREQYAKLERAGRVKMVVGPRIVLTQCWNECLPLAAGDIFMQGNDDIVFRTKGWDKLVERAFSLVPDKILMAYGSDNGFHYGTFGPHPFVHRRWVETVGYFIPPYFSSDFGDKWVNELAAAVNRRQYLPFIVDHLHFLMGKAIVDKTYEERLERHKHDKVEQIWNGTETERQLDIKKLRGAITGPVSLEKYEIVPEHPFPKDELSFIQPVMMTRKARQLSGSSGGLVYTEEAISVCCKEKTKVCPACTSPLTVIFSNGWRCQQCGNQFQ